MLKTWLQAFRLQTLPLSLSGVIVATGIALQKRTFDGWICLFLGIAAISLQILSNLANDYGDGVKGTDNEHRLGPKRGVQSGVISPAQMKHAIVINVLVCGLSIGALLYRAFDKAELPWVVFFVCLGVGAVVAAIRYTMGANPYGYRALGDLFVFVFFGLCAVLGSLFMYRRTWTWEAVLLAVAIGTMSVGVLNINNLRDIDNDRASGKRTLIVLKGAKWGKRYHLFLLFAAFMAVVCYGFLTFNNPWQWSVLWVFVPVLRHLVFVLKNQNPIALNPQLKVLAMLTFLMAVSLLIIFNLQILARHRIAVIF